MVIEAQSMWARFKSGLNRVFRSMVIGLALGDSTSEEWKRIQDSSFDRAKRLSDFVGMLMRAGFIFLCFLFFSAVARKSDFWIEKQTFGMCAFLSLVLYACILWQVLGVINAYWMSDTAYWKNKVSKVIIVILSVLQTLVASYGITTLVRAVAKSSSLVP